MASVIFLAASDFTPSTTIAKAPAASSAFASSTKEAISVLSLPRILYPPSDLKNCGISPICPKTAMEF